jgi:acyl carrier protein
MSDMGIQQRVQSVFRDIFDDENLVIGPETTAKDIPGWDSLSHISLVVAIEKEFKIRFSLMDLKQLQNVGEWLALIRQKTTGAAG